MLNSPFCESAPGLFSKVQTLLLTELRDDFQGLLLGTRSGVLNFGGTGADVALSIAQRVATLDVRDAKASDARDQEMIQQLVQAMPGGFDEVNGFMRLALSVLSVGEMDSGCSMIFVLWRDVLICGLASTLQCLET